MEQWFKSRFLLSFIMFILIASASISAFQGLKNALALKGSQDSQWDCARLLLERYNPFEIELSNQIPPTNKYIPDPHPDPLGAVQVPSCYMLLLPYAFFSWQTAKYLWAASNILFTAFLLFYTFRLFFPSRSPWIKVAITCLFIMGTPWRNTVGNGQHTLFSLAFFIMALWYAEKRMTRLAGVLLAISFFKYTIIFPMLPFFLYKKHYKSLIIAFSIHAVLHLIASAWVREWPQVLLLQSMELSLRVLEQGYLDIFTFFHQIGLNAPKIVPTIIALLLLGTVTLICILPGQKDDLLLLSILGMVSTVLVYHRCCYDFVILIFPLVLVFRQKWNILDLCLALNITTIFYIQKIESVVIPMLVSAGMGWADLAFYVIVAALWYGTVGYGLVFLMRSRVQASEV